MIVHNYFKIKINTKVAHYYAIMYFVGSETYRLRAPLFILKKISWCHFLFFTYINTIYVLQLFDHCENKVLFISDRKESNSLISLRKQSNSLTKICALKKQSNSVYQTGNFNSNSIYTAITLFILKISVLLFQFHLMSYLYLIWSI